MNGATSMLLRSLKYTMKLKLGVVQDGFSLKYISGADITNFAFFFDNYICYLEYDSEEKNCCSDEWAQGCSCFFGDILLHNVAISDAISTRYSCCILGKTS